MPAKIPDKLIDELCQDVAPVRVIWTPLSRSFLWLLFCFALSASLVVASGELRSGAFEQLLNSPRFLIETLLGFLSGIVAAFFAFEMVVPGRVWGWRLKLASVSPFIIFTILVLYSVVDPPVLSSWSGWRYGCEREILLFGSLPMIVFFILARRAAAVDGEWTGMLIGIAAMAPTAALMHVACMYQPWHLLGFHIAPVIFVALIGLYLARRALKI